MASPTPSSTSPLDLSTPQAHLDAHARALATLTQILNSALDTTSPFHQSLHDKIDGLQREVDIWKKSYLDSERERVKITKELEGLQKEKEEWVKSGPGGGGGKIERPRDGGHGFTAVVIDGDGAIFDPALISLGMPGGLSAAKTLLTSLPKLIQDTVPDLVEEKGGINNIIGNGRMIVHVTVNRFGLSGALLKAGLVPSFTTVNEFWLGFIQAHAAINVIDAGPGKEASDSKVISQLTFLGSLSQCSLIILAASHDNGYANPIRSLITEGKSVILLKSVPLAQQLVGICPVGEIEGLFKKEKVETILGAWKVTQSQSQAAKNLGLGSGARQSRTGSNGKQAANEIKAEHPRLKAGEIIDLLELAEQDMVDEVEEIDFNQLCISDETKSSSSQRENTSSPIDFIANRTQQRLAAASTSNNKLYKPPKSNENAIAKPTKPKQGPKKKKFQPERYTFEDGGGGPEERVGGKWMGKNLVEAGVDIGNNEKAIRQLNPRPCHKGYLTKGGCDNATCAFSHHYNLNNKQFDYLARIVKEMPCPFMKIGQCHQNSESCIYGHECPYAEDCAFGPMCRFNELPSGGHGAYVQ